MNYEKHVQLPLPKYNIHIKKKTPIFVLNITLIYVWLENKLVS